MANTYDYVVVGGGFFGARVGVELARQGKKILVLEREKELMQRASYVNQARVHGGYHYPRSLLTALRSRVNLPVFYEEYADCIDDKFEKYYAIARKFSKVSAKQFQLFCERIEAPIERAPHRVRELFNEDLIEDVFTVQEYAFDSAKLKQRLLGQLEGAGAELLTEAEATHVGKASSGLGLAVTYERAGQNHEVLARQVLNCTYARINELNRASGLPELPLKHEITEIALIDPPEQLQGMGVTVMCGPFFSTMPFPSRGKYSLTHVRYTPHTEWHEGRDGETGIDPYAYLKKIAIQSGYPKMLADTRRYLPCMAKSHYSESLFEVKTVLPQSEGDDSRPILFKQNHGGLQGYTCIMGGKLDNIYEVLMEISVSSVVTL